MTRKGVKIVSLGLKTLDSERNCGIFSVSVLCQGLKSTAENCIAKNCIARNCTRNFSCLSQKVSRLTKGYELDVSKTRIHHVEGTRYLRDTRKLERT